MSLLRPLTIERRWRERSGYDAASDVGQLKVVIAGVVAESGEGLLHVQVKSFGDHAFGLFDDDARGECMLQLLVDDLRFVRGAVLQEIRRAEDRRIIALVNKAVS